MKKKKAQKETAATPASDSGYSDRIQAFGIPWTAAEKIVAEYFDRQGYLSRRST